MFEVRFKIENVNFCIESSFQDSRKADKDIKRSHLVTRNLGLAVNVSR
jgi:hypothetical protein